MNGVRRSRSVERARAALGIAPVGATGPPRCPARARRRAALVRRAL